MTSYHLFIEIKMFFKLIFYIPFRLPWSVLGDDFPDFDFFAIDFFLGYEGI